MPTTARFWIRPEKRFLQALCWITSCCRRIWRIATGAGVSGIRWTIRSAGANPPCAMRWWLHQIIFRSAWISSCEAPYWGDETLDSDCNTWSVHPSLGSRGPRGRWAVIDGTWRADADGRADAAKWSPRWMIFRGWLKSLALPWGNLRHKWVRLCVIFWTRGRRLERVCAARNAGKRRHHHTAQTTRGFARCDPRRSRGARSADRYLAAALFDGHISLEGRGE